MTRSIESKIREANQVLLIDSHIESIDQYFSPNYVVHLTDQVLTGGHDIVRQFIILIQRAFTDLRIQVDILVKYRDRVSWQRTMHATHTGSYKGFPATGRSIVWRDMVTSRLEDGLIAEEWVISDLAERLLLARKR